MFANKEFTFLIIALVIIFKIFFLGKIICWLRKKHVWNSEVLWRTCNTCGKKQYLDMLNNKYID